MTKRTDALRDKMLGNALEQYIEENRHEVDSNEIAQAEHVLAHHQSLPFFKTIRQALEAIERHDNREGGSDDIDQAMINLRRILD